jgi:hypothetical protein
MRKEREHMKINTNTKRHGAAAAIELLLDLKRTPASLDDKNLEAMRNVERVIAAYLSGFQKSSPRARNGFLAIFGDYLSGAANHGVITDPAGFYTRPKYAGGKGALTERERKAHAREWLQRSGAAAAHR